VWNDVVFNSFRAGYLKQIDFEFYKRLESAISKRLYRFLDKRFYHRERLEFDLKSFACEHIGLSKKYHNGELKRVLAPAIAELESQGFLKPFSAEERFIRRARGSWSVVFVQAKNGTLLFSEQLPELVKALRDRGLSLQSARKLAAQHPETSIREKIALFDWLLGRRDPRIQKNPAGFLYRSIRDDFSLPDDFRAAAAAAERPKPAERKVIPFERRDVPSRPASKKPSDREAIDRFWNSISSEEQEKIERELVHEAPRFLREQYVDGQESRGLLFQTVRQAMIDRYVRKILGQNAS